MVIVNADDFGLTHEANLGILEAFKRGLIQRTTLVVNSSYTMEAIEMARDNHLENAIGLHFNLTEGIPLCEALLEQPLLCKSDGTFSRGFRKNYWTRFCYLPSKIRQLISMEFKSQAEKFISFGFPMRHLDSHHHIHTDYQVYCSIRSIIRQLGFQSIRLCPNTYDDMPGNMKNLFKRFFRELVTKDGLSTMPFVYRDVFASRDWQNDNVEVMAHPIMRDGKLHDLVDVNFDYYI